MVTGTVLLGLSWLVVIEVSGNSTSLYDDYNSSEYDGVESDEVVPVNNCSEAYLEIMRNHFGCKRGSFYHCNRGLEYDIRDVRILHPTVISGHHAT